MKNVKRFCRMILPVAVFLVMSACSRMNEGVGVVRLRFDGSTNELMESARSLMTRAAPVEALPDTNNFILTVTSSDGTVVYDGKYGDSPEALTVPSGSCYVSIRSRSFSKPAFSSPQYGDDKCLSVPSGGVLDVELNCRQVNSGVKLNIDKGFLSAYPNGALMLKSADGSLLYSYSEKRVAYFPPGNVSMVLTEGGKDQTLLTRSLAPCEMLVVNVTAPAGSATNQGGVSVQIDTSRVWGTEDFAIGGGSSKGDAPDNAMTIAQARASVGEKGVWVGGYIVGGDLTSSAVGISFSSPFSSATNIAIGPRSATTEKSSCLSVQLPSGAVRNALNLVDNPSLLGRQVLLKGDIVSAYYGIVGIKNITEYKLK